MAVSCKVKYVIVEAKMLVKLAWPSSSVMDCHVMAQGSIPGGNDVKNQASRPSKGTVNGGAVSK